MKYKYNYPKCQIDRPSRWCSTHNCELDSAGKCPQITRRDPRVWPDRGDVISRIITNKRGVRSVCQRIVLERLDDLVIYTRKRKEHQRLTHLIDWRKWAKGGVSQPPRNHPLI